ncbi:MAG TPA: ASCH domain-containing protein [Myxococcaceae bacterium]|nr:ASCH domain-containing protein [Myxococcaceae bacterium]
MRAITIRQPWAELIVRGEKDVENRSWRTRHRGPLLIHAGGQADRKRFGEHGVPDDVQLGAIIGVVEVVDCTQEKTSAWHEEGSWGWYLARPRRFKKPIPMKGQRGLFEVLERKVAAQLGSTGRKRGSRRRRAPKSRTGAERRSARRPGASSNLSDPRGPP